MKDAIILLKPTNIKEEGDKIKADVVLSNLTLTWVFTNQVYLPSKTAKVPVGGPVYCYLLGPNQSKVLGTVEFQKGSYLQLNAKSPIGIDYRQFGYEDAALLGAVALDLIMRGFFKKELPSNAFDEPLLIGAETGIGSISHLFYNITSHCSGPLGAFGYAMLRKDISGALEALGKFVICTSKGPIKEKVKDFLKALFSVEVADKWMEKFSTNLVDFLNLPEKASLLYIISKYTFSAPPQGWARIEALEAEIISKLPKTIVDVYNRFGGLSTFGNPLPQNYTIPSGMASTGTPYKAVELYRGGIYESSKGVFAVYGAIYQKYHALGGPRHYLGLPISNEEDAPRSSFGTTGRISRFERGSIVWLKEKNQTFVVQGAIFKKWSSLGYSGSQLGFPTSDEYPIPGGARSDFEGGYITWTSQTGAQVVYKGAPATPSVATPPVTPLKEPIISKSVPLGSYPLGQRYYLRVFNVDDLSKVKINGREILSVNYHNEREIDITGYLMEGKNSIELTLENTAGGWTYGYELKQGNNLIWNDSCGRVGIEGCKNNDQTKGIVARHSINLSLTKAAISTPIPSPPTPSRPTPVTSISARIDTVDITPKSIQTGGTVTLRMRFTNIGNTAHTFIAGASLWRPDGDWNPDLNFERPVTLSPGQTTEITWNAQVDRPGNWGYQFAVWKQKPFTSENLLVKSPSPIAFFNVTTALGKPPAPAPPPATPLPAPQVARPEIISNLRILEPPPYKVGQIITAEFSIRNSGNSPITFDVLTVGGRLNGQCPNNKCPDFEFRPNVTLPPNGSYTYQGKLRIEAPGNYHFFTAYRTKDGQWNTAIQTLPGVRNTLDVSVTSPSVTVPPPQPTTPTQPPQPYVPPSITARIDMADVIPRSVQTGGMVTLRMRFTNTGNINHTFIAGASLWRPSDYSNPVANFERSVTLSPGQSTEVTWSYQPNLTGNWGYQFAVWKQKPFVSSNLLVKHPSPIGFFSVTSPTVQAPAPTPAPAPKPAPPPTPASTPSAQIVSGRIDSYSPGDPNNPVRVKVGGSVTLTVRFTNTGNTAWRFIVGASVWDSRGCIVENYSTTLSSPLQPGQQTSVSWNHQVRNAGDYWVQFGLWKATPFVKENLLDKKPTPAQRVISGF